MIILFNFIAILTQILTIAIFARAIISWFPVPKDNVVVDIIVQITDPVLEPLRRIIPTTGFIDFTPLIAIFLLQMVGNVAAGLG